MLTNTLEILCPICNGKSTHEFISKYGKNIMNCQVCGHFFTNVTKQNQGICLRDENIEYESDRDYEKYDKRNESLLNLFLKKINDKSQYNLLDFGSGNAHISRTFKRILLNKCNIYCFEVNPLCSSLYSKYDLIKINSLDEIDSNIDLIYMIEVIEHLINPVETLAALRKKIGLNGQIFISTPLGTNNELTTNAYDTESHIHFFTENSLNVALEKAGLGKIEYMYYPEMYFHIKKEFYLKKILRYLTGSIYQYLIKFGFLRVKHLVGFTKAK